MPDPRNEVAGEPRAVARDQLQPFGAGGKVRRAGTGLRKEDEPFLPEPGRGGQADEDCRERDQPLHVSSPSRRPRYHRTIIGTAAAVNCRPCSKSPRTNAARCARKAHHLHPVVTIGQHGLTPTVLTEIDLALNAHGLIKVRVFLDHRDERELLLAEIADGLDAAPVQHIGKLFVLWRPQPEPAAEPAKVPRPKRGKTPSAKAREADRKATKGLERVGRRARGAPHVGAYDGIDTPPAKRPRGPRTQPIAPPAKSPRDARKPATG